VGELPHKRSNRMKNPLAGSDAVTPWLPHDSLLPDFNKPEWEIIYPRFVESGLIAPLECTYD
jgi:hypothetical protein